MTYLKANKKKKQKGMNYRNTRLHSVNFDFGECHGLCYTNFDKTDGLKPTSETIKNGIKMGLPNELLNEIQFKNH